MPNTLPNVSLAASWYTPEASRALQELFEAGATTLQLPVGFATADAAVIFTVPTGKRLFVGRPFWEVTQAWTGGSSSAIGLSSSNAAYNTKGDLLGGATGDVLAGLTVGFKGTIGAKLASNGVVVLVGGDTVRFDRITSAFTAGAALVHFPVRLLPTS